MEIPFDQQDLLAGLWRASWQATLMAPVILLLQRALRTRLSPGWSHGLWWIVIARLALPFTPSAGWSAFNTPAWLRPSQATLAVGGNPPANAHPTPQASYHGAPAADPVLRPRMHVAASQSDRRQELTQGWVERDGNPKTGLSSGAFPTSKLLFTIWLAGLVLLAGRYLVSAIRFRKTLKDARPVQDCDASRILHEASRRFGLRRAPELLETPAVQGPSLYGIRNTRLLVPRGLIDQLGSQELAHIFLHEMAHMRRGDHWTQWLVQVFRWIHWYNPVLRLAFLRMDADREIACDALTLEAQSPSEKRAYGSTLIRLASSHPPIHIAPGTLGVIHNQNELSRRIRMIMHFRKGRPRPWFAVGLVTTLCCVFLTDAQVPEGHDQPSTPLASKGERPEAQASGKERGSFETLMQDGKILYELGQLEEAEAKFNEAKALRPESVLPDFHLANIVDARNSQQHNWQPKGGSAPPSTPLPRALEDSGEESHAAEPSDEEELQSRVYRVNILQLTQGLDSTITSVDSAANEPMGPDNSQATVVNDRIRSQLLHLFAAAGVDFSSRTRNQFVLNMISGAMMIRASKRDLETVGLVIDLLNVSPPQIRLDVRCFTLTSELASGGFEWFLGNGIEADGSGEVSAVDGGSTMYLSGILNSPQFRTATEALLKRGNQEPLFAPSVTTLSGRQTVIEVQDRLSVDVLPVVGADGYSIELDLHLALEEAPAAASSAPVSTSPATLLKISTKACVWDGQTLVFTGGPIHSGTTDRSGANSGTRPSTLVFITPTIIDPAGNPVHSPAVSQPFYPAKPPL